MILKGARVYDCIAYSLFHIAKNCSATRSIVPAKELGFLALHYHSYSKIFLLHLNVIFINATMEVSSGNVIGFIRRAHLSESVTITSFRRKLAGQKGECLFNECWMIVMLIWDLLFPFSSVITLQIPVSSVALCGDSSTARFEYIEGFFYQCNHRSYLNVVFIDATMEVSSGSVTVIKPGGFFYQCDHRSFPQAWRVNTYTVK